MAEKHFYHDNRQEKIMSDLPAGLPKWIADHVRLYREDPDKAHMWDASMAGGKGLLPTLLLTSTGRKSGEPRPLPLIYKKVGDNYVIIASKGGRFPLVPVSTKFGRLWSITGPRLPIGAVTPARQAVRADGGLGKLRM